MSQIEGLLVKGRSLQDDGRYGEAIALYEDILHLDPTHAEANFLTGEMALKAKDGTAAVRFLQRAVRSAPDLPSPVNSLAEAYLSLGHYTDAERCYLRLVELVPDNVQIYLNLAQLQRTLLKIDSAIVGYEKAIELSPNEAMSWFELAETFALSYERFDERDAAFRRASELGWDDLQVLYRLAHRHLMEGQHEDALRHFERVADMTGETRVHPAFHYEFAYAFRYAGREAEAQEELELALRLTESVFDAGTLSQLGEVGGSVVFEFAGFCVSILDALGRRDDAIQIAKRIARECPVNTFDFDPLAYPPNTLEQIEAMKRIVGNRDIALLVHGPSIRQLEERIGELAGQDVCYVSLNQFPRLEEPMLTKIGERLDLVMIGNPLTFGEHEEQIYEFLSRDDDNMFITSEFATTGIDAARFGTEGFKQAFASKLIYFESQFFYPPIPVRPLHFPSGNTLSVLLPYLLLGKPKRIFLFGSDGGGDSKSQNGSYFFSDAPENDVDRRRVAETYRRLRLDARHCDQIVGSSMITVSALYEVPMPEVYNVCLDSAYEAFPKISYDDALEMIKAP